MKRAVKISIALGTVVALIAVYLILKNLPEQEPDFTTSTQDDNRIEFLDTRELDLASMEFVRDDGSRLRFGREEREETNKDGEKEMVLHWIMEYPEPSVEIEERSIRDIAYTMSNIYSEQLVTEDPEDLSLYGLDDPTAYATITTQDGETVEITVGKMTPSRTAYYARINDGPEVYALRRYTVEKFFTEVNDLRDRDIPVPNAQDIQYFRVARADGPTVEIVPRTDQDVFVGAVLSSLKMTEPYETPRTIDTQRFSEMMETLPGIVKIEEFIEDNPEDLSVYGLSPARYEWEQRDSEGVSIHLFLGDEADEDNVYATLPDKNTVFTVPQRSIRFVATRPFTLMNKFVMIPSIDSVDSFTIQAGEQEYTAEIKREKSSSAGEEEDEVVATYFLNGKEIEEDPFKKFYQKTIGLLVDAENPDPEPLTDPEITITYRMNETSDVEQARVQFQRFNVDFYAVYLNGVSEFLLSDYQIDEMIGAAQGLLE